MQLRRKIALVTSALVITAPALSACGFNMATDRENSTVAGANNRDGKVDLLNAVLVSTEQGTARLVVTYSNNDQENAVTVESVDVAEGVTATVTGFEPVEIGAYAMVAPAQDDTETVVKGDVVKAGGHVRLVFTFSDGSTSSINTPAMAAWEEYAGWGPGGSSLERPAPVGPHSGGEHGEGASTEAPADAETAAH